MLEWIVNLIHAIENEELPWVDKCKLLMDVQRGLFQQPSIATAVDLIKGPRPHKETPTEKHAVTKLKKIQKEMEAGPLSLEEEGKLLREVMEIVWTLFEFWLPNPKTKTRAKGHKTKSKVKQKR